MADHRRAYLQALGLDDWQLRGERLPPAAVVAASTADPASQPLIETDAAVLAQPVEMPAPSSSEPNDLHEPAPSDVGSMDWEALIARVDTCGCCDLCKTRTNAVFGVGNRQAELMVIGEAPGAEEDLRGEPFVGRAGKLLDQMLTAIGLDRQQVYIANIIKCRPPNNRDPLPTEVAACLPYLARQLSLVQPRLILAVGRIAAQTLLATQTPIGKLRGQIHRLPPGSTLPAGIPLLVTYHPAYLLRSPGEKAKAWQDLKQARVQLKDSSA